VREGAAGGREGAMLGGAESPTPLQYCRATSMDLARAPWISPG
jgi:hypothetical protein